MSQGQFLLFCKYHPDWFRPVPSTNLKGASLCFFGLTLPAHIWRLLKITPELIRKNKFWNRFYRVVKVYQYEYGVRAELQDYIGGGIGSSMISPFRFIVPRQVKPN